MGPASSDAYCFNIMFLYERDRETEKGRETERESPNRVIKRCMVKPDELITGRQMGPRGTVGAEQHGEHVDITHCTHTHTIF